MMNTYIKSNNATFADGEESSSSSTTTEKTTTKKKYNADGTLQDTEVTTLKKGGFVPTGFRRRYS